MTSDPGTRLSRSILLVYSLPALVVAMPTIPVIVLLPDLYGVQLGVGLAGTGLAILVARIFDTVTDPVIGFLSDRLPSRFGRRKPWIAVGAVVAGIGLVRVLDPPASPDIAYLIVWSAVLYLGWTMVALPYTAWGAELSADYDERTRVTSWREGFMLLGVVGAGGLNALTSGLGWSVSDSTASIAWAAIGLGLLVVPLLLWCVPDSARFDVPTPSGDGVAIKGEFRLLIANKPFLRLLGAWFVNGLANGIPAGLFFIYLEFGLGASAAQKPFFVLGYFMAAIAAIPLWQRLSREIGKHRTWCWAMISACAAFACVPLIPEGGLEYFAVVCAITGAALGADLVLPPAIQADVVDYDRLRSGRGRAGLQFAFWSMATKLSLALAVGAALPGLEAAGFDSASPGEDGRVALVVIYSLVPVVIKAVAIGLVWGFPLTARRQAIVRRRLHRRQIAVEG